MRFEKLEAAVDAIPARFGTPGCAVLVMREHEPVFYRAAGFSNAARTREVSRSDLYWIYSVTKVFTAVAALRLIENGALRLDDPVSRFLPEWEHVFMKGESGNAPCERGPSVKELLTMTGGLNYNLGAPSLRRLRAQKEKATLRAFAHALSGEPLDFSPGEHYQYSLCYDLLGAVMEAAAGMPLEDLYRSLFAGILGASDATFFPAAAQRERFSCEYRFRQKTGDCRDIRLVNPFVFSPVFASAGAGLCAGVEDIALLADALANGGVTRAGARLLKPESVRLMASDCLSGAQKTDFLQMRLPQYAYGLGVAVLTSPSGSVPAGVFGWDGAAGSCVMIDPARRASLAYVQHVLDHGDSPRQIHETLREAFYSDWEQNETSK